MRSQRLPKVIRIGVYIVVQTGIYVRGVFIKNKRELMDFLLVKNTWTKKKMTKITNIIPLTKTRFGITYDGRGNLFY